MSISKQLFCNFGCAEITFTQQYKEKTRFFFVLLSFFLTLAAPKLLSLGNTKKKLRFFFVLLSFFLTLAAPKLLSLGNTKKKLRFFFVLLSFFRNFAKQMRRINPTQAKGDF